MAVGDKLYFIIYKPYRILSQFTDEDENKGLGSLFQLPKSVYPVGRLDLDSEGLLLLTNDKQVNHKLLDPKYAHERTYWAQVEGIPSQEALQGLSNGVSINLKGKMHRTKPAVARLIEKKVDLPEREPSVNYKKHPITSWIELKLTEGKNRQVRRMTAAVGHPTLRLVRVGIEDLTVFPLQPGEMTRVSKNVVMKKLKLR